MYEQKHLFDFILDRVEDTASENGLKLPQAFGRWFASMYFDKPQNFFISDGSGDGKVDLFFETSDGRNVDHCILNTKFTEQYNASAPVGFYDEINRFWQAFANKANRNSYLSVVRTELKPKYRKLFEYYDDGNAQLFFVTNHRRNERQFEAVKANGVRIFHLDELLQFTLDYLEDAMPRTPSMLLTGINTVLSADKRDTEIPTSIVFAKLIDFMKYMEGDPYDLLFARNVRLSLGNTPVNKEIRTTFKDSPTEFVFSNNGITMLCEQHTHDPGKQEVKIENPRIVNGSQTLHSIRDVSNPSLSARVMVRIIEVPPLDPDDFSSQATKKRDVIDKISIRSNRQNPIKPWNLVSTDDFQHDLARFFRKKRRRCDWLLQRSPHLEPKTWPSPACPLRHSCRWSVSRWHALDPYAPCFLSSRQGPLSCVSRQIRRWSPTSLPGRPTPLSRKSGLARSTQDLCRLAKAPVPKGLGGLRQTALRRPGICAPVSRALHAPRGHLQPSPGLARKRPGHLRWRDSAHGNEPKLLTLSLDEFLRRFLLHVLPKGFVRIRYFGLLANRRRSMLLPLCFHRLGSAPQPQSEPSTARDGQGLRLCPQCGGPMQVVERLTAVQIQFRAPPALVPAAA